MSKLIHFSSKHTVMCGHAVSLCYRDAQTVYADVRSLQNQSTTGQCWNHCAMLPTSRNRRKKKTLKQWHGKVQPSEISLGCLWTNPGLSSCSQQWDGQKGPLLWFLLVILSVWAGNSMTITFTNYFGSSLTESGSSGTEWKEKDKEETKSKYLMGFFETCKTVW